MATILLECRGYAIGLLEREISMMPTHVDGRRHWGGSLIYLVPEEAVKVKARSGPDATRIRCPWELWKERALR